jgi:hypothetical protein
LWRLALGDDREAGSAAVTNRSLKASKKVIKSFELLCNFPFTWSPICKSTGVMR